MKILFVSALPFFFAHGGGQTQIEQTKAALERIGVDVDWLRFWDGKQTGDLIHYFGVPSFAYQNWARQKRIPLVNTVLFSQTCNRSDLRLTLQALATQFILSLPFGNSIKDQLVWKSFTNSDCNIVGLEAEKRVLQQIYGVSEDRIRLLPLGCEQEFLNAAPSPRTGDYLITVSTIRDQKRILDIAQFAMTAEVPVCFVGKPYIDTDPYWLRFQKDAAESRYIRHHLHVESRPALVNLLQQARGFVLYSQYENWSLAADEAAACGLPLLLPDQRWARERFGSTAQYFSRNNNENSHILKKFFESAAQLPLPPKPKSWEQVAYELMRIYESVLSRCS